MTKKDSKKRKKSSKIEKIMLNIVAPIFIIILILLILYLLDILIYVGDNNDRTIHNKSGIIIDRGATIHKPNIYLYPEQKEDILVKLELDGQIIADYPKYDTDLKGWSITVYPDGKIINHSDNKEYSYLFWEGETYNADWNIQEGFVVPGNEAREFLQDVLPKLGLTPVEYNEFIVYWYPLLQDNPYNLISFAGKEYTDLAPLDTIPKYDSLLRIFMVVKALETPIEITPQTFESFERKGFTVIEWGGTIIK